MKRKQGGYTGRLADMCYDLFIRQRMKDMEIYGDTGVRMGRVRHGGTGQT